MLERTEIIEIVADSLKSYSLIKIVCDPVMVSKNGERLIVKEAIIALKELIFLISNIITPNIFEEERIITKNTHGTGCSLSAAIAAFFAHNSDLKLSVQQAKEYITKAIYYGSKYEIGHRHGPVHHFFNFWE